MVRAGIKPLHGRRIIDAARKALEDLVVEPQPAQAPPNSKGSAHGSAATSQTAPSRAPAETMQQFKQKGNFSKRDPAPSVNSSGTSSSGSGSHAGTAHSSGLSGTHATGPGATATSDRRSPPVAPLGPSTHFESPSDFELAGAASPGALKKNATKLADGMGMKAVPGQHRHPVPEVRAKTQAGGPRKKHLDPEQGTSEDALHTSRSISKASVRPSSPSSLVEWPSMGMHSKKPIKFDTFNSDARAGGGDGEENRTPRTAARKKKAVHSANPYPMQQQHAESNRHGGQHTENFPYHNASPFSPQTIDRSNIGSRGSGVGMAVGSFWGDELAKKPQSRGGLEGTRQPHRNEGGPGPSGPNPSANWLFSSSTSYHAAPNGSDMLRGGHGGDMHKGGEMLPRITRDRRSDFQEPSTDSFLADYLTTLEKPPHVGQGRTRKPPDGGDEGEGRRGGAARHDREWPDRPVPIQGVGVGANKPPAPFFKKPMHQPYDLGGRGFGNHRR